MGLEHGFRARVSSIGFEPNALTLLTSSDLAPLGVQAATC